MELSDSAVVSASAVGVGLGVEFSDGELVPATDASKGPLVGALVVRRVGALLGLMVAGESAPPMPLKVSSSEFKISSSRVDIIVVLEASGDGALATSFSAADALCSVWLSPISVGKKEGAAVKFVAALVVFGAVDSSMLGEMLGSIVRFERTKVGASLATLVGEWEGVSLATLVG